jgi:hypothetical protein
LVDQSLPIQPEYPHQRIERDAEIPEVLGQPQRRVLIDADDAIDQESRPATGRKAMISVALINRVRRCIKPSSETFDQIGVRFVRGTTEDCATTIIVTGRRQLG